MFATKNERWEIVTGLNQQASVLSLGPSLASASAFIITFRVTGVCSRFANEIFEEFNIILQLRCCSS